MKKGLKFQIRSKINMEEKRKKLAFYFDELELPFSENEVLSKLEKLNEKELDILILMCEEILGYENAMAEELENINPKELERIEKEYLNKKLDLQKKLNGELEESQRIYDEDIDELEEAESGEENEASENTANPK